ncbi:RHS repeat-associated core domain-containing protein, partial [Reichenbachiella sp.]
NFKYNDGAERVSDFELNVDMTLYRVYDPTISRWWQIDPLADAAGQESWTSYHYSFNNPISYNDPLGDNPWLRLVQMAQRARVPLQRYGRQVGQAIQLGWNNVHRTIHYSSTSPMMRQTQNWVATNIQGATSYYYRNAQLVGEAGAFVASAIDPNPAANYSIGAGDELGNAVGATLRRGSGAVLDFFGGAKSSVKNGVSIDPQAVSGFRGTISEFAKQFSGSKVGEIVANNPQATFVKEAADLLEYGGTLTVRGTMSNKFFNKIAKGKGLDGFEVIQDATEISNVGYQKTDGTAIAGQMFELILRRSE